MTVYVCQTPEVIRTCMDKVKNRRGLSYLDINQHSILIPSMDSDPLHILKKLKAKNDNPEHLVYLGLGFSKDISGVQTITSFATMINDKLEPISDNFLAFESGTCLSTNNSNNQELVEDLFNVVDCFEENSGRWYLCCEALGIPFTCSLYLKQDLDADYNIEQVFKAMLDKISLTGEATEQSKDNNNPDNLFFQSDLYWTKSLKTRFEKAYATYLKNNRSNGIEQIELYLTQFPNESPKKRTLKLVQFLEQQNNPEIYSTLNELEEWTKINSKDYVHFNYDKKLESSKTTVSFDFFSEESYQEQLQVLRDADIAAFYKIVGSTK